MKILALGVFICVNIIFLPAHGQQTAESEQHLLSEELLSNFEINEFLDPSTIRIILALSMLGLASFFDIWKREIHDFIWIGFGSIAVIMLLFEPNLTNSIWTILLSLIIAPFAILIWRIGLFGGADAFALIVLAALTPMITLSNNIVSPFTTLSNAALLFVIPFFANGIRNAVSILKNEDIFAGFNETRLKKSLAVFVGYRAKNPNYGFSIEKIEGGCKKLDLGLHNAEKTEFCTSSDTWITPGIPYMLLITGGFIIQLLFGDILMNFLKIGF